MVKSLKHLSDYVESIANPVKRLRFVSLVLGAGLTAVGHYGRGAEEESWLHSNAETVFWVGLTVLLLTNLVLVFVDKQAVEILRSLHLEEERTLSLTEEVRALERDRDTAIAWLTLGKLMSELVDQAIEAKAPNNEACQRLYSAAVEFISEYRLRLFGIGDDYLNISIYEFKKATGELECVACYRSRPSDATASHRTWKRGEGHVGKAFELQSELVCGDARAPDVAAWIAAPPDKVREEDRDKYVSLAAIPIAVTSTEPLGVVIVTSDVPYRFVNFSEAEEDYSDDVDVQRAKYAVAALQDIAAQIAQLMSILQSKNQNSELPHEVSS